MTMHGDSVVLWDTSSPEAVEVGRCSYTVEGEVLSLMLLPEANDGLNTNHIVAVTSKMKGVAWEIRLPHLESDDLSTQNGDGPCLRQYATFDLGEKESLQMFLPTDPVGWTATLSGTLDKFSREVAISVTKSGVLRSWSARCVTKEYQVQWLNPFTVETGVESPSLVRGTSLGKAALVSSTRNELTIWGSRSAQLEYKCQFDEQEVILDLDWTCTPDSQSILAVGFSHRVLLLSQLRYDYLHRGPAWAPFREIKIGKYVLELP